MLNTYRKLFDRNLGIVRGLAETDIETCVQLCDLYNGELSGIVTFLHELDIIDYDTWTKERDRVQAAFDSIAVCGAYRTPGKVRRCSTKMRKTLGNI